MTTKERYFQRYTETSEERSLVCLLEYCYPGIYKIGYSVLKQAQDTEDVVQNVLLKIVDKINTFEDFNHFDRWLYRTALNAALDLRKSRLREINRMSAFAREQQMHGEDRQGQAQQAVGESLSALEDKQRHLILAHYFEGYTLQELSKQLDCSHATVANHLREAREALRRLLKGQEKATAAAAIATVLAQVSQAAVPQFKLNSQLRTAIQTVTTPSGTTIAGAGITKLLMLGTVAVVTTVGLWHFIEKEPDYGIQKNVPLAHSEATQPENQYQLNENTLDKTESNVALPDAELSISETEEYQRMREQLLTALNDTPSRNLSFTLMPLANSLATENLEVAWKLFKDAEEWFYKPSLNEHFLAKFKGYESYKETITSGRNSMVMFFSGKDPESVLKLLLSDEKSIKPYSLKKVFQNWFRFDREAAQAALFSSGLSNSLKTLAIEGIVETWLIDDAAEAMDWLNSFESDTRNSVIKRLVSQFQNKKGRSAAKRWEIVYQKIQTWKNIDVAQLFQEDAYTLPIIHFLIQNDYRSAIDSLKKESQTVERDLALCDIFRLYLLYDFDSAFTDLEVLPFNEHTADTFIQPVIRMAQVDPAEAAFWFKELIESPDWVPPKYKHHMDQAIAQIIDSWLLDDFDSAYQWAINLESESYQKKVLQQLVEQYWKTSPHQAIQSVLAWPEDQFRTRVLVSLFEKHSQYNAESALQLYHKLELNNDLVLASIVMRFAYKDIEKAAQFIESLQLSSKVRTERRLDLYFNGKHEPIARFAAIWAEKDLREATNWVNRISEGDKREIAGVALVKHWSKTEPVLASIWAQNQNWHDPTKRKVLSHITIRWAIRDSEKYHAWLWGKEGWNTELKKEGIIYYLFIEDTQIMQERLLKISQLPNQKRLADWAETIYAETYLNLKDKSTLEAILDTLPETDFTLALHALVQKRNN